MSNTIEIAICDDNKVFCERLHNMLDSIQQKGNYKFEIDVYYSGEELVKQLQALKEYDIIYLDIELDKLTGIDVGQIIREKLEDNNTKIFFVSGDQDYAMKLFKIRPMDFLIKPINYESVEEGLRKAIDLINKDKKVFRFSHSRTNYKINIKDIIYFESEGRIIKVHTKGSTYEYYDKLSNIEKLLREQNFLTIHKSIIVNYSHIVSYKYDEVALSNGKILPISQSNRKRIRTELMELFKG